MSLRVSHDSDVNLGAMADQTDGYSGADVKLICRDASMAPMRRLMALHSPEQIASLRDAGQINLRSPSACCLTATASRWKI